jgi:hypothetical protein
MHIFDEETMSNVQKDLKAQNKQSGEFDDSKTKTEKEKSS